MNAEQTDDGVGSNDERSRRWILTSTAGAAALLAGCSGSESESGSGGSDGSGTTDSDSGGDSASTTAAETQTSTAGESTSTEATSESTSTSPETTTETDTETSTETETATEGETETETATETESDSGDSGAISDSGDTDVELESADIADAYSLDSAAYYEEDYQSGVRGEITNTSDDEISYTSIEVKFYDDEGTRLGESLDNATDLGAGETYAYDVLSALTGDKSESVASYTMTVTDGI
jgi:cytoskeletal protein RodZ